MWRTYNESGTLTYSFIDSLVAMHPLRGARARRAALPDRRRGRFLQHLDDHPPSIPTVERRVEEAVRQALPAARSPQSKPPCSDPLPTGAHRSGLRSRSSSWPASADWSRSRRCSPLTRRSRKRRTCGCTRRSRARRTQHLHPRSCYACHSQMIRTLRDEVERYGPYSLAIESQYDHPMLWGSNRPAGSGADRRQVFGPVAGRAPDQSARPGARSKMPACSLAQPHPAQDR